MANNPLLNSLGSYAAWDPLRAAAQRRTSFNPAMVSMRRPGGPQAPQRASAPATQQQPVQQPTRNSLTPGYSIQGPNDVWANYRSAPLAQPSTVTTSQDVANRNFQDYVKQLQQRVQQQLQPTQQQQLQPMQQQPAQQPISSPWAGIHSPDVPPAIASTPPSVTTGWWQGYGSPFQGTVMPAATTLPQVTNNPLMGRASFGGPAR